MGNGVLLSPTYPAVVPCLMRHVLMSIHAPTRLHVFARWPHHLSFSIHCQAHCRLLHAQHQHLYGAIFSTALLLKVEDPEMANALLRVPRQSHVSPAYLAEGAHAVDLIRYNLDGLPRLIGDLVCPCLGLQTTYHLHGEPFRTS